MDSPDLNHHCLALLNCLVIVNRLTYVVFDTVCSVLKQFSHCKLSIFRRQKILCTRNAEKELLTDKKEFWKKIAPYNRYCDYCGDLNYKYGSELYGMDKSKNVVNWTKVVEDDDY